MEALITVTYIATLLIFTLFHYLRVSSHHGVLSGLSGLHNNFHVVQLGKWLLSALSIVVSIVNWGIIGAVVSIIVLILINQIVGFCLYRLSIQSERKRLLEDADFRLFPETMQPGEKYLKAEKIATDKIDKNVADKAPTNKG